MNDVIRHLPPLPDWPGEINAEDIRLIPGTNSLAEFLEIFWRDLRECRLVMMNQLEGYPATHAFRRLEQFLRDAHYFFRRS